MAREFQFPSSTAANPRGIILNTLKYWEEEVREFDGAEVPLLAEVLLGHAEGKKRKRDDEPEDQLNFPWTGVSSSSRPKRARRAPKREPGEVPLTRPVRARRAPKVYDEEPPAKKPKKAATTERAPSAPARSRAASRAPSTIPALVAGSSTAPPPALTGAGLVSNARGKMVDPVESARAKANWAERKTKGVEDGDAATKVEE